MFFCCFISYTCPLPSIIVRASDDSKLLEEIKVLRDVVEKNQDVILALERRLNDTVDVIQRYEQQLQPQQQPVPPFQPQQQQIDFELLNATNSAALAALQLQLDSVTNLLDQEHQERVELLISEAKNDVKRLEEKTSNWLNQLGMDYENSMTRISKTVESLTQAQAGPPMTFLVTGFRNEYC